MAQSSSNAHAPQTKRVRAARRPRASHGLEAFDKSGEARERRAALVVIWRQELIHLIPAGPRRTLVWRR